MTEQEFILNFVDFYDALMERELGIEKTLNAIIYYCNGYSYQTPMFLLYLAQDGLIGYIDYFVHSIKVVTE